MQHRYPLELRAHGEREIVMTRKFAAPRALVFRALSEPELVKRWLLGPPGWSMPVCAIDFRVGGAYRYVWRNEQGVEMAANGVFREIAAPARIVHTERFEPAWYAGDAMITSALAERAGVTTLTMTLGYATREARDGVLQSPMESGVAMSYDRLETLLDGLGRGEAA